jgi:AraC family transcriptional regulator
VSDTELRAATSRFFQQALKAPSPRRPHWIGDVDTAAADLHPAWLARAYRAWRGEGLAETARRHRVEMAVQMLRVSTTALAAIAMDSGFCDQSHMNRCFNAVLGRNPPEVRREAKLLAAVS